MYVAFFKKKFSIEPNVLESLNLKATLNQEHFNTSVENLKIKH